MAKTRRSRRDWLLPAVIALVVIASVVALTPVVLSMHLTRRYETFSRQLAESIAYGQDSDSMYVIGRGLGRPVNQSQAGMLLIYMMKAGVGHPRREMPDEECVRLTFGDGSELWMCPTELHERNRLSDFGTYFRYVGNDGRVYAYDTDNLWFRTVLFALGEPWSNDPTGN